MAVLDLPVTASPKVAGRENERRSQDLGTAGLRVRPLDPGTDGERLRGMCRFDTPEELVTQIDDDVVRTRKALDRAG